MNIKPRYTFKKKFYNVDGAEMMQLTDLVGTDALKNTTDSFSNWAKMDLVREIKEDFLSVSEE